MSDRFHHLFIAPRDFDASIAFYRDVLGWAVIRTWSREGDRRGAELSGGGMEVIISETRPGASNIPMVHLDIHDVDARFRELPPGTHVVTPPETTPWGTRWFVVRDPDGNLLAFEEAKRHGG
jgi:catechol 2,3-dioxygenase-like lactoylglutathione lyase family enzyme